ncbi:unnamed protein product [Leptosia nina]|uniref:Uncharacterized protein n=1 Tax=Leptosia nina TaxID=320188 RepID=A0AAV1JB85_9NEOP
MRTFLLITIFAFVAVQLCTCSHKKTTADAPATAEAKAASEGAEPRASGANEGPQAAEGKSPDTTPPPPPPRS